MKIVAGFKNTNRELLSLENEYSKRLSRFTKMQIVEMPHKKGVPTNLIKTQHADPLLQKADPGAFKVLLAEDGANLNSQQFAKLLEKHPKINFFIGGPYGIDKSAYSSFNQVLSISSMTFTAEFSRVLLLEQIYRGFSILNNLPYHKQ